MALVLAESTGRRIGSIRQLRWEDIDLNGSTIHWRADADKKRKIGLFPYHQLLVEELKIFQRKLSTVGGWICDGSRPDKANG